MLGREGRIISIKQEVNELLVKLRPAAAVCQLNVVGGAGRR
jgi:hypothetical protein